MRRTLLKSKIHRAIVTDANRDYPGSVTVDRRLLEAADIVPYEQVQIYNLTNGTRLTTYAISGEPATGMLCINGAAAHLVQPGHLVILASYAEYEEHEVVAHCPRIILVDDRNRIQTRTACAE